MVFRVSGALRLTHGPAIKRVRLHKSRSRAEGPIALSPPLQPIIALVPWQRHMMHVIQPLTVKAAYNIHHIAKQNRPVESSGLWCLALAFDLAPFPLVYVELVDIVESLLVSIDSTKNVNVGPTDHCGMPISALRRAAISSMNLVPVIR